MNDKYGLRIYNYEAASIYNCSIGVKEEYDKTRALFARSLFSDFLRENGLKSCSVDGDFGAWTKDIVCVDFSYGAKSFEEEIESLEDKRKNNPKRAKYFDKLIDCAKENKEKFKKKSVKDLRKDFYENGFFIKYDKRKIDYKMLYRSVSKAKKGSCMFINKKLYDKALNFLRMGNPKFLNEKSRLVEISAYQTLVASTIVGKVKINPKNILVIKDVAVPFERNVVTVSSLLKKFLETDADASANCKDKMANTLFDGQSLIDSSVFDKSKFFFEKENKLNGYILLRQHFFKSAAFCTEIKQFFKDYCSEHGRDFETFTVKDIWGKEHFAKDIELITTENSIKWWKFGNTFEDFEFWRQKVSENGDSFGIVKTAHESKQGQFQRMSYQMVNALENDPLVLGQAAQCSYDYVEKLKKSDSEFLIDKSKKIEENEFIKFLIRGSSDFNDYDFLYKLCKKNRYFLRCDYYRERKKRIINEYVNDLKSGKIIQSGENLVIVGSPYAMLLAAVGEDVRGDNMFEVEKGQDAAIQCYTQRFSDGAELAEFRSPFNARNNLGYMRNKYPPEKIKKYFARFGKQIVAVNMIGTDFQARNNGSDQDSDIIYTTDEPSIVACAKKFYKEYPTIINDIPEKAALQTDYASVDNTLAGAKDQTGKATNLAQLCLTYSYNFPDSKEKFEAYLCILSVLAQIAIDEAKHNFSINAGSVIKRISDEIKHAELGVPVFWRHVWDRSDKRQGHEIDESLEKKREKKVDKGLKCPMNYIYTKEFPDGRSSSTRDILPIGQFFIEIKEPGERLSRTIKKGNFVEALISKFGLELLNAKQNDDDDDDGNMLLRADFEDMVEEIKGSRNFVSSALCSFLIARAFGITLRSRRKRLGVKEFVKTQKNKSLLLKTLSTVNPDGVSACFKKDSDMANMPGFLY